MKRMEKSNNLKNKIVEVTRRLFVNQGYQKTTIRQIIEEAGINIGTLYHFFRDKEDIFLRGAEQTDIELVALVESLTKYEKDYVFKYAIYRALEFKMVEKSDKIAELYLESYSSWRMTQMVIPINWCAISFIFTNTIKILPNRTTTGYPWPFAGCG